ncbi:hypothetical protein K432DRAFT_384252 [Lepidopterella palustris CBS 459.81]|uniref:Uncharacterized protein n=1 Tax=Lepidopterella palustris CBS 459.81 TaxID=1314670 RepID=A0A8E2JCW0_9PEZI|nr:hypothetical protein K432DRAFT_384252 [Lepidopterella palustris CBS 459.81]
MPSSGADDVVDVTSSLVFDDTVYRKEVLSLPEDQTEDELDERIANQAKESGVEDPYRYFSPELQDLSTAMPSLTVSSEHRSSMSIRSRESQSTGFTSDPSRNSNDHHHLENPHSTRNAPQPRSSTSFENYDAVLDKFRPVIRNSYSSSTYTTAGSTHSPSSTSKPTSIKRKRGPSLLSMFRRESHACTSRVRHGHPVNPFTPRLECGHTLTKYATRIHIQDALENENHLPPNCCGKPLPKSVLEMVMTKEEMDDFVDNFLHSPRFDDTHETTYSHNGLVEVGTPAECQPTKSRDVHVAPKSVTTQHTPEDDECLNAAMDDEAFCKLRAEHEEQFQRIVAFESKQRHALSTYYDWSRKRLSSQLTRNKVERAKEHAHDLEQLDETQVAAEHDLRRAQVLESQNVATALKYMEAYCNGFCNSSADIKHTVSDEDRKKLKRQHALQDNLPHKHESAINVLRAKQEKDVRVRMNKQYAELAQMDLEFEKEMKGLEVRFLKDLNRLGVLVEMRRRRAVARWELKFEIWRKGFEKNRQRPWEGRLPHLDWPDPTAEVPLEAEGALAQYFRLDAAVR